MFINMLFTSNKKPYKTERWVSAHPVLSWNKHSINSFVYQGAKQWNALPADARDFKFLNVFKNYRNNWTGPDCLYSVIYMCYKDLVNWYHIPWNKCWSNIFQYVLVYIYIYIYKLLRNIFILLLADIFMCCMQNVYGNIVIHAYYAYEHDTCFKNSAKSL